MNPDDIYKTNLRILHTRERIDVGYVNMNYYEHKS